MWRVTAAALAIVGTPIDALACPFCDGTNGRNLVKEELFTENFWYFGLATLLPFAVCVAIVAWLLMNPQSATKRDLGFLGSGVVLIALGLVIIRSAKDSPMSASSRVHRAD